jgi:hypothetical protein
MTSAAAEALRAIASGADEESRITSAARALKSMSSSRPRVALAA